jgi:hypothetical protein
MESLSTSVGFERQKEINGISAFPLSGVSTVTRTDGAAILSDSDWEWFSAGGKLGCSEPKGL